MFFQFWKFLTCLICTQEVVGNRDGENYNGELSNYQPPVPTQEL